MGYLLGEGEGGGGPQPPFSLISDEVGLHLEGQESVGSTEIKKEEDKCLKLVRNNSGYAVLSHVFEGHI